MLSDLKQFFVFLRRSIVNSGVSARESSAPSRSRCARSAQSVASWNDWREGLRLCLKQIVIVVRSETLVMFPHAKE